MNLREIHYWDETFLPIISILFNILALYLIKNYTTKEMKPYGRILAQECVVELSLAITLVLIKHVRKK
jgi:hypothetical protein